MAQAPQAAPAAQPAPAATRTAYIDAGCAYALVIDADTLLWPMGNGYLYTVRRQHP